MKALPKTNTPSSLGTKSPSYLILRSGTWHFRKIVPRKYRKLLGDLKELRVSLKTGLLREARIKAFKIAFNSYKIFRTAQNNCFIMKKLDKKEIRSLIKSWLVEGLDFYENEHLTHSTPLSPEQQLSNIESMDQLVQFFKNKLAAADYSVINQDWLISQLKKHDLPIPETNSLDMKMLSAEFMKATVELSKIQAKRYEGDFSDTSFFNETKDKVLPHQNEKTTDYDEVINATLVSEALHVYIDEKVRSNSWTQRTVADFVPKLKFFIQFTGDIPVNQISKDTIRNFKIIIDKLPSRYTLSKEYRKLSLKKLMAMDIPVEKKMSASSLSKYYGTINSFLIWLDKNYNNVNSGLTGILTIKINQQIDRLRDIFTTEDLDKIFKSDIFVKKNSKQSYKYWVPLLGLYSGMRLEEICQLYLSDIVVQEGINCININDDGADKQLKTPAANRIIPIRPILINSLGFLDFVQMQKNNGHDRLFPELKKQSGRFSHYVSRWFNSIFLVNIGIKSSQNRKLFHSFRHNFANACKIADVEEYKAREFLGHDVPGKSITYGRYGKRYSVKVLLNDVLERIELYEVQIPNVK